MEAPVKVEVRGRCMSARSAPGTPFHAPRLLRVYARAAPPHHLHIGMRSRAGDSRHPTSMFLRRSCAMTVFSRK